MITAGEASFTKHILLHIYPFNMIAFSIQVGQVY